MITVISPSKKQDFTIDASRIDNATLPDQFENSQILIKQLLKLSKPKIQSLMGISANLAELNHQRYRDFSSSFTEQNSKPAMFAFKGDVYLGLDIDSYKKSDFNFAQKHLRILSGLYGALRPLDLIQPYRLEMGTKFINNKGKNLYQFWGNQITDQLNQEPELNSVLINLASQEYFKSVKPKNLDARVINIIFKESNQGSFKVIGYNAKLARGLMVNFIIKNKIDDEEKLKTFNTDRYKFNSKLSSSNDWVFTRKQIKKQY